jgi:hypothetical protein
LTIAQEKGGRSDLVEKESAELSIIMSYLPQQYTDEEVMVAIETAIAATQAQGTRGMGKVWRPQVVWVGSWNLLTFKIYIRKLFGISARFVVSGQAATYFKRHFAEIPRTFC